MPSHLFRRGPPIRGFSCHFRAEVEELAAHRRDFVAWMRAAHVSGDAADDLEVVFSEVTTNAVSASPSTSDDVRVCARITDGMFLFEVSNHIDCVDSRPEWTAGEQDDPLRQRGRGLLIARAYLDFVHTHVVASDRFVVRCGRRLAPAHCATATSPPEEAVVDAHVALHPTTAPATPSRSPTTSGTGPPALRSPDGPGSGAPSNSATAVRPSRPKQGGWCSPTTSVPCAPARSVRARAQGRLLLWSRPPRPEPGHPLRHRRRLHRLRNSGHRRSSRVDG